MEVCKNCQKELVHVAGRRKKEFCNDSCRVKFWVKNKPKKEIKVTDLTTPTKQIKPVEQPKTNYTINTTKKYPAGEMPKGLTYVQQLAWKAKNKPQQ